MKIASWLLASLALTIAPEQDKAPNFINWAALETWSYTQQYDWEEQSRRVELLQFWLNVQPKDGIYGRRTHIAHRQAAMAQNIPVTTYDFIVQDRNFGASVEQWRLVVEAAILANGGPITDVPRFLQVMKCESNGDPNAYNKTSGASGLMQHLATYWDARSQTALGYVASPFDGPANINVSAWLIYRATGGGWQHWVCM